MQLESKNRILLESDGKKLQESNTKHSVGVIDLHIHTTASDGSFTPTQIVNMAVSNGLSAISITDHDTIDGVREALQFGIQHNLEFITGVELSVQPLPGYEDNGSIHILGYGFSIYDRQINAILEKLKDARADRNPLILEKLGQLGFSLTMDEVIDICGPGQMGRPHIAKAMVEKEYVESFDDAFDHYLGKGKPAYVDKFRLSCKDSIKLIIEAGGIPVLAHPGLIRIENIYKSGNASDGHYLNSRYPDEYYKLECFISQLTGMGLMGIEVFHTDHSEAQTEYFKRLAQKKGLLMTGGSDFHGTLKQGTQIGIGKIDINKSDNDNSDNNKSDNNKVQSCKTANIDKADSGRFADNCGNLSISHDLYKNLSLAVERARKTNNHVSKLEDNLLYSFNDSSLLLTALRHSSYVNEVQQPDIKDNQRLEFLGDAVLGLAIAHLLMQKFPDMKEGELSKLRSTLVSESGLAAMARYMDIGRFIYFGKGERLSRGAEKNSILADTFEAIIAAIYLEIGFKETCELISVYFDPQISQITSGNDTFDYKSMLQEMVQEMGNFVPCYKILRETGPDHEKTFEIVLNVCDVEVKGEGKNKKSAEQNAAANAIAILKDQNVISCSQQNNYNNLLKYL